MKPLLKELGDGNLPFLCLEYKDTDGVEHSIMAVYLAEVHSLDGSKLKNLVSVQFLWTCGHYRNFLYFIFLFSCCFLFKYLYTHTVFL